MRREEIEVLGVPCIGVTVGSSQPGLMVLTGTDRASEHRWESSNHLVFITRGGRLVATRGLRRDLVRTHYQAADPLLEHPLEQERLFARDVDLAPGDHLGVRYESRLIPGGRDTITVLDRAHDTALVLESVRVQRWSWQAENRYWLDPETGVVVRALQHLAPDSPPILVEYFRPGA